ncbi:hypothetical protein [Photobacterium sp. TY1-4]|uniref:hypothetical protein n=1 Tax=Photobacterium sp. TY1-4 TaxID=2899122 RepID=UPI0021C1F311|nr:hypothetical protein [Photobacterium sp. TY1-4]UXI02982.1 hypothetical protein NH461_21280 [Photobacterium sp. TY1-4]
MMIKVAINWDLEFSISLPTWDFSWKKRKHHLASQPVNSAISEHLKRDIGLAPSIPASRHYLEYL